MHSILILEDHKESADFIATVAREVFPDCELFIAPHIQAATALIKTHCVNLALIDLNLPDGDGNQFIRFLHQQNFICSIIVTTIYDDDKHLFDALRCGASGYLLKESSRTQLIAALKGIIMGQPPLSPAIARRILRTFRHPEDVQANTKRDHQEISVHENKNAYIPATETANENGLTKREINVLSLVAKGYSRIEIAQYLGITAHTSASHIKNIYRKLNVGSRAEAAVLANRLGLS